MLILLITVMGKLQTQKKATVIDTIPLNLAAAESKTIKENIQGGKNKALMVTI
jgi:hypothetical protein